jgi:BON domain
MRMNINQLLPRGGAVTRDVVRISTRLGARVLTETFGLTQRLLHLRQAPKPGMDDVTLASKVETEILRGTRAPKPAVNVNAVDSVVWLRGEVKRPQQIRALERKALSVP